MGKRGFARKRDANEPGIVAALERAGATVVSMDKPVDLLVGFNEITELVEVKNGNQPPSWQRITPDQKEFFDAWDGCPALIVTNMRQALAVLHLPPDLAGQILEELAGKYDEAGEPLAQK